MKNYQKVALIFWLTVITISLTILLKSGGISPETLKSFFEKYNNQAVFVYLLIFCFRSFTLIPATTLLFAGLFLFHPFTVLFVAITGTLVAGSIVYFFAEWIELDQYLKRKYPQQIEKFRKEVNQHGFGIIIIWSLIPFIPSDIICYLAGTIHYGYRKFILAFGLGIVPLLSLYIYTGDSLFQLFS